MKDEQNDSARAEAPNFRTTHWSVVLAARQEPSPDAETALATLCRTYWYPLYGFIRRRGHGVHDAQDLTQSFFERLLEKNALQSVSRDKGRFRCFLLASLNHFLDNEWDRAKTLKRGGQCSIISLDVVTAEDRYHQELAHELTPEKIFERRWALALLEQVLGALQQEYAAAGKAPLFETLQVYLSGEENPDSYAPVAAKLNLTEGATRVAVHRLRRRYGELLRAHIADTVTNPNEIDDEIQYLFAAMSG